MRQDEIENLIAREVRDALDDMARDALDDMARDALRNPTPEIKIQIDGRALGLNGGQLSAALQMVASRVR